MADIAVTPASVAPGASSTQIQGIAGETITAGMAVYQKSTDSKWYKALASGTAQQSGNGVTYGIALTGSSAGQPIVVDTSDPNGIAIGGTTVVGTLYCVSATAGGICPWVDLVATNYVTVLGVGQAGNKIVSIANGNTGIQHA